LCVVIRILIEAYFFKPLMYAAQKNKPILLISVLIPCKIESVHRKYRKKNLDTFLDILITSL
jgi:hypothetical protein